MQPARSMSRNPAVCSWPKLRHERLPGGSRSANVCLPQTSGVMQLTSLQVVVDICTIRMCTQQHSDDLAIVDSVDGAACGLSVAQTARRQPKRQWGKGEGGREAGCFHQNTCAGKRIEVGELEGSWKGALEGGAGRRVRKPAGEKASRCRRRSGGR
eukprot:143176-Chlamydomonas_euryale.AAC.2